MALEWYPQIPDPIRPRPVRPLSSMVLLESTIDFTPASEFMAKVNPDDYLDDAVFHFEAIIDTDSAPDLAFARLVSLTDGMEVAGSQISTAALHGAGLTTLVRSGPIALNSGEEIYQAERGGEAGSGATIHIHAAKIIVIY